MKCQGCNEDSVTTTVKNGDEFCSVCLKESYILCLICGEYIHVDESTANHCDSCSTKGYEQCGEGEHSFYCDPKYWDCECSCGHSYIHSKAKGNYCPVCKMEEGDCPDSRVNEVAKEYDKKYDTAVKISLTDS